MGQGNLPLPRSLVVETHRGCNFSCTHCNVPGASCDGYGPMPSTVFDALTPLLEIVDEVGYDNFGEPTLNSLLPSFIRRQKDLNPKGRARLNSNMSLLNVKLATALLESGLNEIQVSVDAASDQLFAALRVGGSLASTLKKTEMMANIAATCGCATFTISACLVAQTRNIEDLPDVVTALSDVGVDVLYVNGLEPYSLEDFGCALWQSTKGRTRAWDVFALAQDVARRCGMRLYTPHLEPGTCAPCELVGRSMTVGYDGMVSPCFLLAMESPLITAGGNRMVRPRIGFGNVCEKSPLESWASPEYRRFRESAAEPGGGDQTVCTECLQRQGLICVCATGDSLD